MSGPPSITLTAFSSKYVGRADASKAEDALDNSEGFKTTAFPAATAPITGSNDSPAPSFFVFLKSIQNQSQHA